MWRVKNTTRLSALMFFVFFYFLLSPSPASAKTTVSGTLSGDVTWTKSGSPYIAQNVIIPSGSSLTIKPGVIVKVPKTMWALSVYGTLSVGALDAEKVVFTSLLDDTTIDGDTNDDGSQTTPSLTGDWYGIYTIGGTTTIDNTIFRYGGFNIYATVYNGGAQVSVSHSDFSFSNHSVIAINGTTEVYDNTFRNNDEFALWQKGGTLRFGRNIFTNNSRAVMLTEGAFQNDGGNSGERGIVMRGTRTGTTIMTKDTLPYIIDVSLDIPVGSSLTVAPGAVIKTLLPQLFFIRGNLTVGALDAEQVIITSLKDDTVLGDTNRDGSATVPAKGNWCSIDLWSGVTTITNTVIRYGGCSSAGQVTNRGATVTLDHTQFTDSNQYHVRNIAGQLTLTRSELTGGVYGFGFHGGSVTLRDNSFHNNTAYGVTNTSPAHTVIDATNNWWGDASGPKHPTTNPFGLGDKVSSYVLFNPWLGDDPLKKFELCVENCSSNVMFLPGIKASRLYKDGTMGTEDKLWLPNYFGGDMNELALDENGKSLNKVYTRDVLDEVGIPIIGGNIYMTFLGKLASLKSDGIINDYEAFAYDWRQNVEDVAQNGTPYPDGEIRSAVAHLQSLATLSKSNKVTIIAHSNGGLLAKAIMMELEKIGQADKVDKIVFVGTPQMGTPISVLSLLYGYDEGLFLGKLISREGSRAVVENMPGVYGLLPSGKYFDRMDSPFITFSSQNTRYKDFSDAYGEKIQSYDEFKKFLLATDDNREKPTRSDVEFENVLNGKLLNQAAEMHMRLDNWTPSAGVDVIEIAGWGLDTVSGVEYAEKEKMQCSIVIGRITLRCTPTGEYETVYDPKFTVDGDKVVVVPSALMLPEASNVKKYWVDLYRSNKFFTNGREHKDILEFNSVEEFLNNVVTNTYLSAPLPNYLYNSRPSDYDNAKPRLRMALYSPLDIHLYDDAGNHTGPKKVIIDGVEQTVFEEGIPNSYYYQFGERKYVGFGSGEHIRIEMDGYAMGSYTLKMEEVQETETGDAVIAHTTFENLPTTPETIISLDIPETGLANVTLLEADMNSDGINDYEIVPVENGIATLDITPPVTAFSAIGTRGTNSWYTSDVTVTLAAQDEENGSGVATTDYSIDNGVIWNTYTDPVIVSQEGMSNVLYTSTDKQGNKEKIKTETVKVDKTVPETQASFVGTTGKNDWYVSDVVVTLSAKDSESGSGMETAQYSLDSGKKWQTYTEPFILTQEGIETLLYASTDRAGNKEEKHSKVIKIDKTAPEISFSFDPAAKKLAVIGNDNLSAVKADTSATGVTVTDEAGHTIVAVFAKNDAGKQIKFEIKSLAYDGISVLPFSATLNYEWSLEKTGDVKMLNERAVAGGMEIQAHYLAKDNITVITKTEGTVTTNETKSGLAILQLVTEKGAVKITY